MKLISMGAPIEEFITYLKGNICPNCGQHFYLAAMLPSQEGYEVYEISEDVHCPRCSIVETKNEH